MTGQDPEGPGEHDAHLLDDADEGTVPCPECGEPVWAEAEKCPHCGTWISHDVAGQVRPAGGRAVKPWWWWVAIIVLLAAFFWLVNVGRPW